MTIELWLTVVLLAALTVVLIKEWIEPEIAIFSVVFLLIISGVISIDEALAGFANQGMLIIAILFVVAGALYHTGIMLQSQRIIFGTRNTSVTRKLSRILFPITAISAFMNNTPLVALLIPAIRSWTEKHNYAASKFLIPISYAAILGGSCTLIGTSTNLVVHGLMLDSGMPGMGLFEISAIAVPVAAVGVLFLILFADTLLPERKIALIDLGENTREFVIELKVTSAYENIGKTIEEANLRHLKGLFLFQIERNGDIIAPAPPDARILQNDRLFFTGVPKTILELQRTPGLQLIKDSSFDLKRYNSADIKTYEAVVSPGSPLVGRNVRDSHFRERYQAVIIAIHRHGSRIESKIGDIVLRPGDTLLLLAGKNFRQKWYHSKDFYLVSDGEQIPSRPQWQGYFALAVFLAMLALSFLKIVPVFAAAGLAAVLLILTRTITSSEARQMVHFRVLLVIAGSFGLAAAVSNSGLADYAARFATDLGGRFGAIGVLTALYVVTNLYTAIISNNAAAAILFPIAMTAATAIGADARPFALIVALAAAGSFITPIGYQTNLMVYGPGGYKFKDFLKAGLPLQLVTGILTVALMYWRYF